MTRAVEVDAPAKINLRLAVLARELSGYHALETLFCAVSLHDTVRVVPGGGRLSLSVDGGVEVGPDEDNLVMRAARRFFLELGGVGEGASIALHKRIPAAAGLGGGSSDAAATLLALNALHSHRLPADALLQMAIELGSDVPFFLAGSTLALGWSRGERLLALPPLPSRPVLIAHPGVPMPTGAAFQRIAELRGGAFAPRAHRMALHQLADWGAVAALACNDFQAPADEQIPQLAPARAEMRAAGALVALLAGSGASLFGVFPDQAARDDAAARVRAMGLATWCCHTLEAMPHPRPGGAAPG